MIYGHHWKMDIRSFRLILERKKEVQHDQKHCKAIFCDDIGQGSGRTIKPQRRVRYWFRIYQKTIWKNKL